MSSDNLDPRQNLTLGTLPSWRGSIIEPRQNQTLGTLATWRGCVRRRRSAGAELELRAIVDAVLPVGLGHPSEAHERGDRLVHALA